MEIIFLGTGEAFDENTPNNSHLIISKKAKLLLDCGFTAPYQLWKYNDKLFLDGVFISHLHADHYFGLPALLVRMWGEGRTRLFSIIYKKGFARKIKEIMEYAYEGFLLKFKYKIKFIEVDAGRNVKFKDLNLSFAPTKHSANNLAIKAVDNGNNSVCYSGDGMFAKETEALYRSSDLVIQETYLYNKEIVGHASVVGAIKMAERNNVKCLALTHINRNLRPKIINKNFSTKKVKVIIPKPIEKYNI